MDLQEWVQLSLTSTATQSILIVNPTSHTLSHLISPQFQQDSFPFSRFPRLGHSPIHSDNNSSQSNSNTRNRSVTNPQPSSASPLSKSTSSLCGLDPNHDDQIESRRDRFTSSSPAKSSPGRETIFTMLAEGRNFGKTSLLEAQPLNLTRLSILSKDEQILKASESLILEEETKEKERTRWKDLEINLISAEQLDSADERLKGHDCVILDVNSGGTSPSLSPSECMPVVKLYLTKYKPAALLLIVPSQPGLFSKEKESRNDTSRGWSSGETLENFCASITISPSNATSSYAFTRPISLNDENECQVMVCALIRDSKSGKRISGSWIVRGGRKRGERRWTSAALLGNRSLEDKDYGNLGIKNPGTASYGSSSISSLPLCREFPFNVNNSSSSSSTFLRPQLSSASRSISTSQVPISTSSRIPSTSEKDTKIERDGQIPSGEEKERERNFSPCSNLLRGRSISIESSPDAHVKTAQVSPGLITSSPTEAQESSRNNERSRPQLQKEMEGEYESSEGDHDDDDGVDSSSSASSICSFRGRRGKAQDYQDEEETLRSPRSRKQEILPWLSTASLISSPELGTRSPGAIQNGSSVSIHSNDAPVERGRDTIVRAPVRMDEVGSNQAELKFPHTVVLRKIFYSFDGKHRRSTESIVSSKLILSPSSPKPNSFDQDPIFDEVISELKSLVMAKSESSNLKGSSGEVKSDHIHIKFLSEIWQDSNLRRKCHGKISWLLDSIRLVDPSDEEIFRDSKSDLGELIGSDGKNWSLRLNQNKRYIRNKGRDSRNLDRELLLVYSSTDQL